MAKGTGSAKASDKDIDKDKDIDEDKDKKDAADDNDSKKEVPLAKGYVRVKNLKDKTVSVYASGKQYVIKAGETVDVTAFDFGKFFEPYRDTYAAVKR